MCADHKFSNPAAQASSGAYRPDIDGLRTIAVVPVVLFHAGFSWISGGYVGVDVFFVISGFLITRILAGEIAAGRFSILGFYERRARRILPALFAVLATSLVAGWIFLLPDDFEGLSKSIIATLAFLSNFWFSMATSDYFGPGAEMMPLLHTWSLAVEEQFYIFFPIFLWLVLPRGRRLTIAICLILGAASLVWAEYLLPRDPTSAFYLPLSRAWELGVGSLLALGFVPDLRRDMLRELVAVAGLLAILFAIFFYKPDTPFPGLTAVLPVFGTAALIATGGQGPTRVARLLALRPMVFIGLISYSLYLWHWPVFVFIKHFYGTLVLPLPAALAGVVLAFGLGWLSWAVIERPFRRRPPHGPSRGAIFAMSGAGMALFGALALGIFLQAGMPGRFGPELQATIAAAQDKNPSREACFGRPAGAGLCQIGATTGRTDSDFLLWGDSHADALVPGFDAAAMEAGRTGRFAGLNACPPLLGVNRVDLGAKTTCSDFNDTIFGMLEARDDLQTVILIARWALTAEGTRPHFEHGKPAVIAPVGAAMATPSQEGNFVVFETALRETVAALRATGREVVLLGGVPEIGWNVPRRVSVRQRWGHDLPPHPDLAEVETRNARVDALFAELAADPGIRHVPLAPALCDPDCRIEIDGQLIYYDDDHLNAFGAEQVLVPLLRDAVF